MYKVEQSFNVLNGVVPSPNIQVKIVADEIEQTTIPNKEKYDYQGFECEKETKINFDVNTWEYKIEEFSSWKDTCTIKFTTKKLPYKVVITTTSHNANASLNMKSYLGDELKNNVDINYHNAMTTLYSDYNEILTISYEQSSYQWVLNLKQAAYINGAYYDVNSNYKWSFLNSVNLTITL